MSDRLASNNPFRDRAESSTRSAQQDHPGSRNPFLDIERYSPASNEQPRVASSHSDRARTSKPRTSSKGGEDSQRRRKDVEASSSRHQDRDPARDYASPSQSYDTAPPAYRPNRPRSVSETSALNTKKDRTKERSDKKDKSSSAKGKGRKNLDKIDLLDVTGFAATGGFHHDGPFDACNPHRNKNSKKAPVLAFAKDSTAMTMAAGPPTQPVYFGDHLNNVESFADYGNLAQASKAPGANTTSSFNPTAIVDQIHGYESVGLGTTTFLEGAPASRSAMLGRSHSDNGSGNGQGASGAGLGRKKSVLQKIRGAYKDRAAEGHEYSSSPPVSPYKTKPTLEYFDGKKEQETNKVPTSNITFQLTDDTTPSLEPPQGSNSSRLNPLYRPSSNGAAGTVNGNSGTNGLIKRVKSLRVSGKRREE